MDQRQWRGLREDALNPGSESSLVRGWGDYGNATRTPETHVHSWSAQWRNKDGDLLTYGLQYEYATTAKPELSKLKVFGLIWPANVVRAQLGSRADGLAALMMPALFSVGPKPGESSNGGQCSQPHWSDFVSGKSTGAAPVRALPFELTPVRSIDIQSDIDGLAGRIAAILQAQYPRCACERFTTRFLNRPTRRWTSELNAGATREAHLTASTCARPFSTSTEVSESGVSRLAC